MQRNCSSPCTYIKKTWRHGSLVLVRANQEHFFFLFLFLLFLAGLEHATKERRRARIDHIMKIVDTYALAECLTTLQSAYVVSQVDIGRRRSSCDEGY